MVKKKNSTIPYTHNLIFLAAELKWHTGEHQGLEIMKEDYIGTYVLHIHKLRTPHKFR